MSMEFEKASKGVPLPDTPVFLIILALLFVPGVYILLVLSAALTVAIGGGLIIGIGYVCGKFIRRIPVGLLFFLGIGVIIGIFAVLKGLLQSLWRKRRFEPAVRIDVNKEPALKSFVEHLCGIMQTKFPKSIILHAEPTFFVTQGKLRVFNGKAKGRILAIGVPLLNSLTTNELRAILSHEFAHFTGRDTLYSSLVLPVYVGTITALRQMSAGLASGDESGSAGWMAVPLILPSIIMNFYLSLFHPINMKISRLRERRADAIAVLTCGSKSFSSGLTKVVGVGGAFHTVSGRNIVDALKKGNAYSNYYEAFREMLPDLSNLIEKCEKKALSEQGDPDDSHPTLTARLEHIPAVDEQFSDSTPAEGLLTGLSEYEKMLTAGYTQLLGFFSGVDTAKELRKR